MSEAALVIPAEADPYEKLREAAAACGASVSFVPPPDDPRQEWRKRAEAYNSSYKGPPHWVWFINVVAATGSLYFAARHAGVTYRRAADHRERYSIFAQHLSEALAFFNSGVLEHAAIIRAVDGIDEPVFHQGVIVGYKRRYSDTLLIKLLESRDAKYRVRTEITGADGTPLIPDGALTNDQRLAALTTIFDAVRARLSGPDPPAADEMGAAGGSADGGVLLDG